MISYMISLSLSLIDAAAADQHVCAERGRESGQRENQFSRDLPPRSHTFMQWASAANSIFKLKLILFFILSARRENKAGSVDVRRRLL